MDKIILKEKTKVDKLREKVIGEPEFLGKPRIITHYNTIPKPRVKNAFVEKKVKSKDCCIIN